MEPQDAAAALMAREAGDEASAPTEVIDEWLRLDEANVRAWVHAQSVWNMFQEADDDDILGPLREESRGVRAERRPLWPVLAASVMLALALSGIWLVFQRTELTDPRAPRPVAGAAPLRYATARGQPKIVALPDGSRLTLDAETVVEVAYTAERRKVTLRSGRAHFEVAPTGQRPFSVAAAGREVIALGTRFDVRVDPGELLVVLVEGRVSVGSIGAGPAPAVLRPGQQFSQRNGAPPVISRVEPEVATGWREGVVTFQDETLVEAAAELNRYSVEQLIVRDPAVAGLRISGAFRTGDMARFGRTLKEVHPVEVKNLGEGRLEIVAAP
jgi:transmembrane sensor